MSQVFSIPSGTSLPFSVKNGASHVFYINNGMSHPFLYQQLDISMIFYQQWDVPLIFYQEWDIPHIFPLTMGRPIDSPSRMGRPTYFLSRVGHPTYFPIKSGMSHVSSINSGTSHPFPSICLFRTPVSVKLTIIYRRLWEFVLRFVQQPGALSQNCQYSQRALGKFYNFDFDHVFRHEPPTSSFSHYAFPPKRKFRCFPLSLLRIQTFWMV